MTRSSLGHLHLHYAWGGAFIFLMTLGLREKGYFVIYQSVATPEQYKRDEYLLPEEWVR